MTPGILSIVAGNGVNGAPSVGPATGSRLGFPTGVAVDGSGVLYISDSSNSDVEEVTTDGSLSIVAGNGTFGAPTYGGPATSSHLHFPQALDVSAGGVIYIANTFNYTIDRVVLLPPFGTSAPVISGTPAIGATLLTDTGGWTNSPNTFAYQWQECDGSGINCVAITGATASTYTITGSDVGHTLRVVVTASNAAGSAAATSNLSAAVQAAPTIPPPAPITTATAPTPTPVAVPVSVGTVPSAGIAVSDQGQATLTLVCPPTPAGCDVSGVLIIHLPASLFEHAAMVAEQTDSAATGTVLASFSGRHIAGGHSALIAVQLKASVLHQLQTLRIRRVKVTLTISDHLTGGPAVSTTHVLYLRIPPLSAGACPVPTGQLTATTVGPVTLSATRARERHLLPAYTARNFHTDNFCLYGGSGIRVGYASPKLLGVGASVAHPATIGRVILALTANPYYTLDGIRPGTALRTAQTKLKLSLKDGIRIGLNTWYLAVGHHNTWVLKVRNATVNEIGTANKALTTTRAQQRALLSRF